MKVRKALLLLVPAIVLTACSTNKELSLLHDDDVYFIPERSEVAAQFTEMDKTAEANTFIEESSAKSLNESAANTSYADYYDGSVAEKVLQDTSAVAKYYNTAYNAPQYYNRDRFRFSVGIGFSNGPMSYGLNYGSGGWGASMGYGYPFGMGYGGGYGWNPYGGYGGYHCPSIYNSGSSMAGNIYSGPRPNVGGNTGTGSVNTDLGDIYYRDIMDHEVGSDRLSTLRTSYTDTRTQRPIEIKQPIYYSAESTHRVSKMAGMSMRSNNGFANFMRDAGRTIPSQIDAASTTSGSRSRGGRSSFGSGSKTPSSRISSPSRSFSVPRGGGGMRR